MKKQRKKTGFLILSIILFLYALVCLTFVVLNPVISYDDLNSTEGTVNQYYVVRHRKSADDRILITKDNRKFFVNGKFDDSTLKSQLTPGTDFQAKYYLRKTIVGDKNIILEINCNQKKVCEYKNDSLEAVIVLSVVGVLLLGVSCLSIIHYAKK